jgi:hypothetical protein
LLEDRFESIRGTAYGLPRGTGYEIMLSGNASSDDTELAWPWSDSTRPMFLEVTNAALANVYLKLAFGRPITDIAAT